MGSDFTLMGEHTWSQVRLVEEELTYGSLGEAYEANCARYGREVDLPIVLFKRRCSNQNGQLVHDPTQEMRLSVSLAALYCADLPACQSLLMQSHNMWVLQASLITSSVLSSQAGGTYLLKHIVQRSVALCDQHNICSCFAGLHIDNESLHNTRFAAQHHRCVQAYEEVKAKVVSETIFSQFMYKILPSCNHLFVFKKQLCSQMALSGAFPTLHTGEASTVDTTLWHAYAISSVMSDMAWTPCQPLCTGCRWAQAISDMSLLS